MNQQAEKHLVKAETYLAKGDDFYRKAAEEIEAAMAADPTLSDTAVGERLGRSRNWVRNVRHNLTAGGQVEWDRGSHGTKAEIEKGVEKALADPKRVEQIVRDNPAVVSKALAEDDDFAFDAMTDPQARLNAGAAGHKHQEAARAQVRSEEKARNKDLMSEKEYDGLLLLQLGQAGGEIVQAARTFARTWSKNVDDLSEEGRELAIDLLAKQQIEINQILDAARGSDLDTVLAEILG